ncbi:MAG TPA: hypothetical protein VFX59_00505 [Polyangiales bacterium]|nr:hypothetical protein [Polyangiales bacterium]
MQNVGEGSLRGWCFAAVLLSAACSNVDSDLEPHLILGLAARQPDDPDAGRLVFVQSRGADHLLLESTSAVHARAGSEVLVTASCESVATTGTLQYFRVYSPAAESLLFAALIDITTELDAAVATNADASACQQGRVLITRSLIVSRELGELTPGFVPSAGLDAGLDAAVSEDDAAAPIVEEP